MHNVVHRSDTAVHRLSQGSSTVLFEPCPRPTYRVSVRGCDVRYVRAPGWVGTRRRGGESRPRLSHPRAIHEANTTVGVRAVSIADDVRPPGSTGGGPGGSPERQGESGFDRTPPQDIAAEQCVLGGMLLSKDAVADVVEILRSHDFYRPAHATVFDIILDLYGRGEPADPITVAAALTDAGDLARGGGAAYLHTLISSVPTAANSSYYARIVAERAVLRRLV